MRKYSIAIRRDASNSYEYPQKAPFDPSCIYPEFENMEGASIGVETGEINHVYENIRNAFSDLELDLLHKGTRDWNPFSDFISKGDTVVIKPNLVSMLPDVNYECIITNPSIVRVAIDYAWKATGEDGLIIVGDSPSCELDWEEMIDKTGYREMIDILNNRGINVLLKDFRTTKTIANEDVWVDEQNVDGVLAESQIINLGRESEFFRNCENESYHGGGYDIQETSKHHRGMIQEYKVSKEIISADVIISIPKFKTHKKAGITCCLKNLVGINTDKNYLPHFTLNNILNQGDEMPPLYGRFRANMILYNIFRIYILGKHWKRISKVAVKYLRRKRDINIKSKKKSFSPKIKMAQSLHFRITGQNIDGGSWPGNLTIARMIIDLNKIFLCTDKNGILQEKNSFHNSNRRKCFFIVDAYIAGMGDGPKEAVPGNLGIVAAGFNGFQVDTALLKLLRINPDSIPVYRIGKQYGWLTGEKRYETLLNGQLLTNEDCFAEKIVPPSNWNY